jgi:hypothetical protein
MPMRAQKRLVKRKGKRWLMIRGPWGVMLFPFLHAKFVVRYFP